jgi:hypothetical protein
MNLDRRGVCVVVGLGIAAVFAGSPIARAGERPRPSAQELWRAYPLTATATATAASGVRPTATAAMRGTRSQAATGSGEVPWVPIVLAAIACAAVGGVVARRRRPAEAAATTAPPSAPSPPPAAEQPPQWPWPDGVEALWRCEIALAPAALSRQVQAVVLPPDGGSRPVLTATPEGRAEDWQSSEALDEVVAALAAELEAHGWEPVPGGRPHTRRLCWRHEGEPFARAREAAWSA